MDARHLNTDQCYQLLGKAFAGAVSPDFKKAMDELVEVARKYVAMMEKDYNTTSDVIGAIGDYFTILDRYASALDSLSNVNVDELSVADLVYYYITLFRVEAIIADVE